MILEKRKHKKWTKISQEHFPRTQIHEFPHRKDFWGTQYSGSISKHFFMKSQNTQERENSTSCQREKSKQINMTMVNRFLVM